MVISLFMDRVTKKTATCVQKSYENMGQMANNSPP